MEARPSESTNPLGLNLDFLFGRGYLWAKHERLSDWITLEHLRMEIPDLSFPFDARGGLNRFRNTRSLVREIEFSISEVGLGDLLRQAAEDVEGFDDVEVHFLDGAVHISTRVRSLGADTFLSFRAALIPPEPARADEVHLSLYDYRAYGPLPYPARLLAFELLTRLLNTPLLRPPGRGSSFTVGIAGDILSFRPLKLILLHIFPRVGWKLPNLSDIQLEGAQIRPGLMSIRATSNEGAWTPPETKGFQLGATREGARALAAYEAKDLFANADQALFDRQIRQATQLFAGYRDVYGLHSELVARTFDCLLADPTPANLAEVESLLREVESEDPKDLRALLARPNLALSSGRRTEVRDAFDRLSAELRERGETRDWVLCELAAARFIKSEDPEGAARKLREVLKVAPRNRVALERLRELYVQMGETSGVEEVLKRLTGVYTDRESLTDAYLALARHLMDREGELGEARIYLERALRLDPTQLEALNTLGESYVMSGEPLRALKAFGSAARAAESRGESRQASRLHFRVASLWNDEIGDPGQALLACRRALKLGEDAGAPQSHDDAFRLERAEQLEFAARVCEERENQEEAIRYWMDAIPLLEQLLETAQAQQPEASETGGFNFIGEEEHAGILDATEIHERLVDAHRHLGDVYDGRGRAEAAASHWRRLLELAPRDRATAERLETLYRRSGKPEQLIELYDDLLRRELPDEDAIDLRVDLAEVYRTLGMLEEAREELVGALNISPDAARPRRLLREMLVDAGRFEMLRDILNGILLRTKDREPRWDILMELGEIQLRELAQPDLAAKSFFEALQIRPSQIDALFQAREALEELIDREGIDVGSPVGDGEAGELLQRVYGRISKLAPDASAQLEALTQMERFAERRGDESVAREARRRREALQEDVGAELDTSDVDERLDQLLDEAVDEAGDEAGDEAVDEAGDEATEPPESPVMDRSPAEETEEKKGDEDEPELERLTSFRKRFEADVKKPQPVPKVDDVDADSPMGRVLKKRDESSLHDAVDDARASGKPAQLAETLQKLVEAAQEGTVDVRRGRLVELRKELGELLYYDLEESQHALPHLEWVRDTAPDGPGAEASVLNALEAIYEEHGRVEGRIDILKDRLERAESDDMDAVYRLLIAQLVWEEFEDREEAGGWLEPILERDPRHEATHRLLGEMARDIGDFESAVDHFETVLAVSAGGLDEVEIQRKLADLLLEELRRPEAALDHYRQVLTAAPGDAQALDGVKQCQAALGHWDGYVESLGQELGLLIGRPGGVELSAIVELDADDVPDAVRVPASQIVADVADIVENELDDDERARQLWGNVHALWHEHVEALERRIDLDRKLEHHVDLAHDLEAYADMLLDTTARFEALAECARIHAEVLGDAAAARPIYTEALAIVEGEDEPPEGVDEARRALKSLDER